MHPDPGVTGSPDAYTDTEWAMAEAVVAAAVGDADPDAFTAILSRSTYGQALELMSPDVEFTDPPVPMHAPVLIIRVTGPIDSPLRGGGLRGGDPDGPATGSVTILDASNGQGLSGTTFYDPPDQSRPLRDENGIPRWMPPIEPALEQDAVPVGIPAELIQLQKQCAAISGDFHTDDGQTSLQRQIPATGLPDRPETAWLCLSALADLEDPRPASAQARLEASQAQQVVDLYNTLPAATPTCQVEENAPAGLIVLDYPDQTRYLLEVRNNDCWSILTANDHRQGGQDMRDILWELTDT